MNRGGPRSRAFVHRSVRAARRPCEGARRSFAAALAAAMVVTACTPPPPPVQLPPREPPSATSIAAGDWPSYNRDLAGTRHSPLRQIDTANVGDLQRAWSYALGRN